MISTNERNKLIVKDYQSLELMTIEIAEKYGITARQVQRIAKDAGVVRTQATANKVMARYKKYHTVPEDLRRKRTDVPLRLRFEVLSKHKRCAVCGEDGSGSRLEVDHVNEDATDHRLENLQVLCGRCNYGKYRSNE